MERRDDCVAGVVPGNEGHTRTAVTARTREEQALDRYRLVEPSLRSRPERPHVLGLQEAVAEVATGRAEHQLVGVRRVYEAALDDAGEVRREPRDPRDHAIGHLVGRRVLLLVGADNRQIHRERARRVLARRRERAVEHARNLQTERWVLRYFTA